MDPVQRQLALQALVGSPLFGGLPASVIEQLLEACDVRQWRAQASFASDQLTGVFHVVLSGQVCLRDTNPETGHALDLLALGPGDAIDIVTLLPYLADQIRRLAALASELALHGTEYRLATVIVEHMHAGAPSPTARSTCWAHPPVHATPQVWLRRCVAR